MPKNLQRLRKELLVPGNPNDVAHLANSVTMRAIYITSPRERLKLRAQSFAKARNPADKVAEAIASLNCGAFILAYASGLDAGDVEPIVVLARALASLTAPERARLIGNRKKGLQKRRVATKNFKMSIIKIMVLLKLSDPEKNLKEHWEELKQRITIDVQFDSFEKWRAKYATDCETEIESEARRCIDVEHTRRTAARPHAAKAMQSILFEQTKRDVYAAWAQQECAFMDMLLKLRG